MPVPPEADTVSVPSLPPLQLTFVLAVFTNNTGVGSVIVTKVLYYNHLHLLLLKGIHSCNQIGEKTCLIIYISQLQIIVDNAGTTICLSSYTSVISSITTDIYWAYRCPYKLCGFCNLNGSTYGTATCIHCIDSIYPCGQIREISYRVGNIIRKQRYR